MTTFRRVLLAAMLIPGVAAASQFQDLGAINESASRAANGAVRPVDTRLKLVACSEALLADPPTHGTVSVHCKSSRWRVRVLIDTAPMPTANAPIVIKRGDPVRVDFVAPGFLVTTNGIAESEARIGERVRVRVEQKAGPVMGEAIDAGSVRVGSLN